MNGLKSLEERIIGHIEHPQRMIMEFNPAAMKRQLAATQKLMEDYFVRVAEKMKKKDELYEAALDVTKDNHE